MDVLAQAGEQRGMALVLFTIALLSVLVGLEEDDIRQAYLKLFGGMVLAVVTATSAIGANPTMVSVAILFTIGALALSWDGYTKLKTPRD